MGFLNSASSSTSSTSPTTTELMSWPTRWTCSTSRPARTSAAYTSSAAAVRPGTSVRNHETGTRTSGLRAERQAEALVALVEVADVSDAVAEHQGAVEPHAEGEAGVALGVDPAGAQHGRVDHAAAAPLDPALARADAARLGARLGRGAPAVEALQV